MKSNKKLIYLSLTLVFLITAFAIPTYVWGVKGPEEVNNLSIERENGKAILSWENGEVDYYLIYRDGELINSTEKTKYIDEEIENKKPYNYEVIPVFEKVLGKKSSILLKTKQKTVPKEVIEVTNEFKYIGSSSNPYLVLEIKNTGKTNLRDIDIEAAFYLGEEMIGSSRQEHFHSDSYGFEIIKPGETVPYMIYLEMSHNEVIRKIRGNLHKEQKIEIFIQNSTTTEDKPYLKYEIEHSSEENKKSIQVSGEVKNIGEKDIQETKVLVKFYNKTFGLIGFEKTILENHQKGETREFKFSFDDPYYKLQRGEVQEKNMPLSEIVDSYEVTARGR